MAPIRRYVCRHKPADTEVASVLQGRVDDMITTAQPGKRLRADAVRNRERVLDAAKAVFHAGGADASLEAVARRAGVGIGTLYRHFPTRESLFEAVYRREVEQLGELAERLQREESPVDALRAWMHATIEFVATKKGMSAALAVAVQSGSALMSFSSDRLGGAVAGLLRLPVQDGLVRGDVEADDLLRALIGLCYTQEGPGWQAGVHRMVDVLVDGLRVRSR